MARLCRRDRLARQRARRQAHRPGARGAEGAAGPQDRELRGGSRRRDELQRLHVAQGVLFRSFAADRPEAARASVRRSARMLSGIDADSHPAAREARPQRQTRPCRRLPACDPLPAPKADGAPQPRLPRPVVPAAGVRPDVRRAAGGFKRKGRLSRHGRDSRARARTRLRPKDAGVPDVVVTLPSLALYDQITIDAGAAL